MRERLEGILARTDRARAWGDAALPFQSLINRDGYVPIKTRLHVDDLDMLVGARAELLCFSELGLRLLDLHQPRDAGGITSDAAHPILRCRSCMWRWPCPTFRAMSEALDALPAYERASPASEYAPAPGGEYSETYHEAGDHSGASAYGPSDHTAPGSPGDTSPSFRLDGALGAKGSVDISGYRFTTEGPLTSLQNGTSGRRPGDRKHDLETTARAFVDNGDRAFMRFDDSARDGQAEPRAPIGARGPRGLAPKGHLEDPW